MRKIIILSLLLSTIYAQGQDSLGVTKTGQLSYFDIINEVWGYADSSGNEYALVGVNSGFSIVDVTDPANPVKEHFIAGAYTTWRDIKTWKNYAYVVHDGVGANSDGILIVDLNTVDSANISYTQFYPTVSIGGSSFTYDDAHNIYIDENGVLYLFGSNLGVGGASMFDLDSSATNPPFLGAYNGSYYHDGVARGDTLWGAAINIGKFEVVDVSSKSNPVVMASQATPNAFTHNIWFSDDNQTVFTTDEKPGAYVTAYDVGDLSNITELDRIRTSLSDPTQVIPHNTHVKGDFLVTSYYTSGLQIVDASQPDILVETAYYDTSPLTGNGFEGAWGAYPYLPSGHILITDRQEGLFILQTDYPRASFFTAFIKDSVTGSPIVNASINMLNTDINGNSNIFGNFRDGQRDTGLYQVAVSKPGYRTDTIQVRMQEGVVTAETIALLPEGFSIAEGKLQGAIAVYPNPSRGSFEIALPYAGNAIIDMQVYNLSGVQVLERPLILASGKARVPHQLPAGVYMLRLTDDDETIGSRKFMVQP